MRRLGAFLGLVVLLPASACISQPSLHPLFTEEEALAPPELVGRWVSEGSPCHGPGGCDDPLNDLELRPGKGQTLEMVVRGEGRPGSFELRVARLDGVLYYDTIATPAEDENSYYMMHRLPVHGFGRITVEADRLELAPLDSDWIDDLQKQGLLNLAHEKLEDLVVLTASAPDLQEFIRTHADDPKAFEKPRVFHRAPAEAAGADPAP